MHRALLRDLSLVFAVVVLGGCAAKAPPPAPPPPPPPRPLAGANQQTASPIGIPAPCPAVFDDEPEPPSTPRREAVTSRRARREALKCGTEKWAVKTMSDDQADDVRLTPVVQSTVRELAELDPLCTSVPDERSRPEEFTVYEVVGVIADVKPENDRDLHIILQDPDDRDSTMVVEVADPRCPGARDSVVFRQLKEAKGSV